MMVKIIIFSSLIFSGLLASSQTQADVPYQSLLNINPSFAGSNGNVRNQTFFDLPSVNSTANYYNLSNAFDTYLPGLKSGVGVSLTHENYNNIIRKTSGRIAYSKYFKLRNDLKIIPSVQLGYNVNEINLGWYSTSAFLTPGNKTSWVRAEHFSLNSGLLVVYKNFYAGFSAFDLNCPDIGIFAKSYTRPLYNMHAAYNLKLSGNLLLNFYGQFQSQLAYTSSRLSVNALICKHIIYGLGYQRDAFNINTGFRTDYFTAQASYKRNISGLLTEAYRDSWQLMLSFNLRNKELRNTVTNFEAW